MKFLTDPTALSQLFLVNGVEFFESPHRADSAMIARSNSAARESMIAFALPGVSRPSLNMTS